MQRKLLKKVILLGRKTGAANALKWLLKRKIEVPFVVVSKGEPLEKVARAAKVPVLYDSAKLYEQIERGDRSVQNVDLVISFLFAERIREPLIKLGSRGCINFHPAPLPDYKSRAGYNTAILDQQKTFGVSAHFIDSEKFDAGPIIKVLRFPMDPETETAWSLEKKTQLKLDQLFEEVMNLFMSGKPIRTKKNAGGLYLTSVQLERLKEVFPEKESPEEIKRKIRALFFPPYHGAYVMLGGMKYTLLGDEMLYILADLLKK